MRQGFCTLMRTHFVQFFVKHALKIQCRFNCMCRFTSVSMCTYLGIIAYCILVEHRIVGDCGCCIIR